MERRDPDTPSRSATIRASLREALRSQESSSTARELSQLLGVSERDVYQHLEHLARSLPHDGEELTITPARCLGCGFEFSDRTRFTKPGRCPSCKSTRISLPRFGIEDPS